MMVQLVTIALHPLWCHYLITVCSFGIYGCAIAQNITYTL